MFQFLFKWNNNCHITEDQCEFLNAHLAALFGQEIALHKIHGVERSMQFYVQHVLTFKNRASYI